MNTAKQPRPPQQASIELRLQRVINYLHTHLNEDLDLNKLAEIACMSPCHWHRVYLALYDESVVATVKRLRLQGAATLLSNGDLPIAKIVGGLPPQAHPLPPLLSDIKSMRANTRCSLTKGLMSI